ncbi:uncharacterized protein LOC135496549, partial [Lineus longissimus]|uniref:uncharacterized protein LOC135496549 n=1 Tax=Lineus longissimus TaxID=88925 RepID=UPI00315DA08E
YDAESDPTTEPLVLTALSTGGPWFYHEIIWKDMNSDGKLDVLTARAQIKTFGGSSKQLVWFEAPKWQEHVINNGGDVFIQNEKITVKNVTYDVILAAVFFSKSIVITWTEGEDWLDATKIHSRVISEETTSPFALKYLDVNGDGRNDVLVSLNDAKNGSVIVFEMPHDFRSGAFIRHELCHGFKAQPEVIPMPGRGSPGFIYPLSMKTTAKVLKKWSYDASNKMSFLLSGDDGGFVYILVPRSNDSAEWHYDPIPLFEAKTTVGDLYVKDLDGDGNEDILVAAYNLNQVHIYSFTP